MADRPNIVLLFTDQQRYDTICAAGYPWMKTPNMDRLVEQGCLFPNAYSSNPVCMPARHDMLTGRTARHHGYYTNLLQPIAERNLPTIPEILSNEGYVTCAIGKMHFVPDRRHHGYTEMHLMEELPQDRRNDAYATYLAEHGLGHVRNLHGVRPHVYHMPQRALVPAEHHGSQWVGNRAAQFIDENADRPFLLMAGWIKPHPPWNVPEEWEGLYADADIPEPSPRSRRYPYHSAESDWFGDNDLPETRRALREAYLTTVSMVDQALGAVLDAIDRNSLADNTLVILTSDHGEMLYDKGLFQKAVPYDSAARIPMVMRWPGHFQAGSRDERFVDLLDIMPTVLHATRVDADLRRPEPLEGGSLLPEAKPGARDRSVQYSGFGFGVQRWVMLREVRYKYVYFYNNGTEQFYDMREDPTETTDMISAGTAPAESLERLRRRCLEMEKRLGPPEAIEDGRFRAVEGKELSPDMFSKHPLWSNGQFQTFGEGQPEQEVRRYIDEARQATRRHGEGALKEVFYAPELERAFVEGVGRIGGGEETKREVFGR